MAFKDYLIRTKNVFGKFFRAIGSVAEKIAFTTVLATGIGFIQWARGKFPFTEVPKREYHMTQWFWEKRGPALEGEGTSWYLPPLYRRVLDKDKKPVTVSAETLEHESNEFSFRTSDNLDGKLRVQYLYRVKDAHEANKFYWDYGKDADRLDVIIRQPILEKLAQIEGEKLTSEVYTYLGDAEKIANKRLEDEETGIQITNFAITQPIYSPASEAILKRKIDAIKEAEAIIIKAKLISLAARHNPKTGRADAYPNPWASTSLTRLNFFTNCLT